MFRKMLSSNGGAAAVEFALIAPLFLMLLLSFIATGIYLSTAYSVQQIAADAARTAVAGLSSQERTDLATAFINSATIRYPFIRAEDLDVQVSDDPQDPRQFVVALTYDASSLPLWGLYTFAMPESQIHRYATIRMGGL